MDPEDVLNGFINKYRSWQRNNDLSCENQQMDDVIGKMQASFFVKAKTSTALESLVYLFELANATPDSNYNALNLLHDIFSKRCFGICIKPKYVMNFTLNMISYINENYEEEELSVQEKRLNILKYFTYGIKIKTVDEKLKDFLEILLGFIKNPCNKPFLQLVLIILQNLTRNSVAVQNYIRHRNDPNETYVALLHMLNARGDSLLRILAMAIYINVDTEGAKYLVSSNSTGHTFELIFSIIFENDEDCTTYAVDLMVDLLLREDVTFKNQFLNFKYVNLYLKKLVEHLPKISNLDVAAKVYELVLTLQSIDGLSSTVLGIVFDKQNFQSDQPCPLTMASKWFSEEMKNSEMMASYPAVFLACLLQEATNYISLKDCQFEEQVDELATEIMSELIKCNKVKNRFDMTTILRNVLEDHLRICAEDNNNHLIKDDDFCNLVDVVIQLLIFIHKVKDRVENLQDLFYQYLQDGRLMPVFAKALSMDSKSKIINTLSLINIGMKLSHFPHIKLGEAMSLLNVTKKKSGGENMDSQVSTPVHSRCSLTQNDPNIEESVDQLIYRFKKDLELKHLKPSQIMDIYERKIQMLEAKCANFEQLLDSKTKSLQQAENIISQYRCRWAQDEGIENLHLRNIIHEVEKRNEALTEESTLIHAEMASLKMKYREAIYDLELLASHREKLVKENEEQTAQCNRLEDQLKILGGEIAAMESRNAALESKNSASKVQIEELTKAISTLGEEKLTMKREHKDQCHKFSELKKTYYQLEQRFEAAETNNQSLMEENKTIKTDNQTLKLELEEERKGLEDLRVLFEEKCTELSSLQDFMANVGKMINVRKESNTGLQDITAKSSRSRK
ncbi:hypothetical protein CHUAL_008671 [Chamberlinius hualienensis]